VAQPIHHVSSVANFIRASSAVISPGKGISHIVFAARIRRTWCCIISCSFGRLASLARLPIRDVEMRSSVKSGDMLIASTGAGEAGKGGMMVI
jgi:hypothetical protein